MADKWPLANGVWSNAANWNDGTKPVAGDDVYADGKTVTIDEDSFGNLTTVTRSGGTAGGGFSIAAGVTHTGNVTAGTTNCVTITSGTCEIVGNVTGGSVSYANGVTITSGTCEIVGNVTGGSASYANGVIGGSGSIVGTVRGATGGSYGVGLMVVGSGSWTVTGDVYGGGGGATSGVEFGGFGQLTINGHLFAIANSNALLLNSVSSGTVNVVGNAYAVGGSSSSYRAISHASPIAVMTLTGNVYGGSATSVYGAYLSSTGTLIVVGDVVAGSGSNAYGAYNEGAGTLTITGFAIGSEFGNGSVGYSLTAAVFGSRTGNTTVGGLKFGSRGLSPVYGNVFVSSFAAATCYVRKSDFTEGVLVDSASTNNPPATADVRAGVRYTTGGVLTGTLAVPAAGSVALGVPVDAGVGTAVLTQAAVEAAAAAAITAAQPIRANTVEIGGVSVEPADISQDVRDAMELESTSGEDSIDDKLNAINNEISGTGGIYTQTVTVKTTGGAAIPNATVAIYSGSVLIDIKTTNSSGIAQPMCDAGSYTLRVAATGYSSSSTSLTVTGDATLADIVLTSLASSIPLPDDNRQCTGYGYVYDETGNVATDADICCKMTKEPSGSGIILENAKRTEISSATGLVTFTRLWIGATYYFYRDGSEKGFTVTVREASVTEDGLFPLPNFIG